MKKSLHTVMNQLLLLKLLTHNCLRAIRFSTESSSSLHTLPNSIKALLWITASTGTAPDKTYTAGSATVTRSDRICLMKLLYVLSILSIRAALGVTTSIPYTRTCRTYVCNRCVDVSGSKPFHREVPTP